MIKETTTIMCDCCGKELNENDNYYTVKAVRMAAGQEVEESNLEICAECISGFTFQIGMEGLEAIKEEKLEPVKPAPTYDHMRRSDKGRRFLC